MRSRRTSCARLVPANLALMTRPRWSSAASKMVPSTSRDCCEAAPVDRRTVRPPDAHAPARPSLRTELSSWRDHLGGFQGIGAGKTQLLWIVEVDGQRLMLVVGYFPGPDGPSPRRVAEMVAMAETAEFVDADQVAP